MTEESYCEVAVLNLRPASRLPRPLTLKTGRRQGSVAARPKSPALKFPSLASSGSTSTARGSERPFPGRAQPDGPTGSRIPLPYQAAGRPQTSAVTSHEPSSKSNLLRRIDTVPGPAQPGEEDCRFARLQPLPAIGFRQFAPGLPRRGSESSVSTGQWTDEDVDSTPDTPPSSPSFRADSPDDLDEEPADDLRPPESLFQQVDCDSPTSCPEEVAERPKTSSVLLACPGDGELDARPLVRSKTYDILPAIQEESAATGRRFDDGGESPATSESEAPRERRKILLAIQTSSDDYIYGYFWCGDSLKKVLQFVSEMQGCGYDEHVLRTEDGTGRTFTDLSLTIAEAKLRNRTLLSVLRVDSSGQLSTEN